MAKKRTTKSAVAVELEGTEITIDALKELLRNKITEKFGMTVYEFANTTKAKSLGVDKNLSVYLSNGKVTSFPTLSKLAKLFELGTLTKQTKSVRTVIYKLCV